MAIQLNNVRFAYDESPANTILDIPQWSVAQGERLFVHGPSGCGKSTLLNLLSGVLTSKSLQGEITVLGHRLDTMTASQRDRFRANNIGYVFQQFNLIPYLSAVDNIRLATHFSRNDKADATGATNSAHSITELLGKLGIDAGDQQKQTSKLSIGQQQRVAIARAMVNRPQLLIADEPTSSLDKKNRDTFMTLLTELVNEQQMTLLFVSHDLSLASYFDRSESLEAINQAANSSAESEKACS